jgi:hypothetical protein
VNSEYSKVLARIDTVKLIINRLSCNRNSGLLSGYREELNGLEKKRIKLEKGNNNE